MDIRELQAEQVWPLRREVMWPDKELNHVKLPDDEKGVHYGLFAGERLVSVVSLFANGDEVQFRKFATARDMQGRGYGTKLLSHALIAAEAAGARRIFCNARREKASFYRRFGLRETETIFEKDGRRYVVMERFRSLSP